MSPPTEKVVEMVGSVGLVTGTVARGHVGEVVLPTRGGTQAYHAYPSRPEDVVPVGTRVVVLEHFPPRSVVVEAL